MPTGRGAVGNLEGMPRQTKKYKAALRGCARVRYDAHAPKGAGGDSRGGASRLAAGGVFQYTRRVERIDVDERLREMLRELEEKGRENDAQQTDRSRKMSNLEPRAAQLLTILARTLGATRILEIGTSNGYSTIWLAWAASLSGGRVTSIERNPDKRDLAQANLKRAGLADRVELRLGDAGEVVSNLSGPFDLVFLDADRTKFPHHLQAVLPKLAPRVLVVADNAISHAEEIADYLKLISGLADFQHTVVPVGKGLSVAFRG